MTTLRREAIQTVYNSLIGDFGHIIDVDKYEDDFMRVAESVVDKLSTLRGFSMLKEPFDKGKAGLDWVVVSGELDPDLVGEMVNAESVWLESRDSFEFYLDIQLNWFPAKTSEERTMKRLRENVVKWYTEDPNCFRDYQTWRTQEFVRGALSNVQIKSYPENFEASWSDFRRTMPLKVAKTIKTDDSGSPITY